MAADGGALGRMRPVAVRTEDGVDLAGYVLPAAPPGRDRPPPGR